MSSLHTSQGEAIPLTLVDLSSEEPVKADDVNSGFLPLRFAGHAEVRYGPKKPDTVYRGANCHRTNLIHI